MVTPSYDPFSLHLYCIVALGLKVHFLVVYQDAVSSKEQCDAMDVEMQALERN